VADPILNPGYIETSVRISRESFSGMSYASSSTLNPVIGIAGSPYDEESEKPDRSDGTLVGTVSAPVTEL
jgi:hypothetical protein